MLKKVLFVSVFAAMAISFSSCSQSPSSVLEDAIEEVKNANSQEELEQVTTKYAQKEADMKEDIESLSDEEKKEVTKLSVEYLKAVSDKQSELLKN